jgi:hypothetical protein
MPNTRGCNTAGNHTYLKSVVASYIQERKGGPKVMEHLFKYSKILIEVNFCYMHLFGSHFNTASSEIFTQLLLKIPAF